MLQVVHCAFEDDVAEFYRAHNPAKLADVPSILADAAGKGLSDDDVYAALCRRYSVAQFDAIVEVRERLSAAVPEATVAEVASVLRMAELRGLSEGDARRALERKYKKNRSRGGSRAGTPPLVPADAPSGGPVPAESCSPTGDYSQSDAPNPALRRVRSLTKTADRTVVDSAMAEEIRQWLLDTLGGACGADVRAATNVVDALRDGVVLQLLLQKLRHPELAAADLKRPKAGGFHARDNVSRFIRAVHDEFDVRMEVLFDDADLCDAKNDRAVVTCLLSVAKMAYKRGVLDAPAIVRYEEEIDARAGQVDESEVERAIRESALTDDEEEAEEREAAVPAPLEQNAGEAAQEVLEGSATQGSSATAHIEEARSAPSTMGNTTLTPAAVALPANPADEVETAEEVKQQQQQLDQEQEKEALTGPPAPSIEAPTSTKAEETADTAKRECADPGKVVVVLPPSRNRQMRARKGDAVDERVCQAFCKALQSHSSTNTRLTRMEHHGEYVVHHRITGKRTVVHVRVVQKNLMLRVGGGWEDFELWLERHMVDCETAPAGATQRTRQKEALRRK